MKKSVLAWLFKRIKKQIPLLLAVTLLSMIAAYLSVQLALETKAVLEVVQKNMTTNTATGVAALRSVFSGAFFTRTIRLVAVVFILLILRFLTLDLQERLKIELERNWKKDCLHRLMHGEFSVVHKYHSGDLVNRLSADVTVVDQGLVSAIPSFAQLLTRLIAATVVLLTLEPVLALILLGAGILVAILTTGLRRKLKNLHKKEAESNGRVNSFIQETLEKLLVVQAMDVADEMDHRADVLLNERKKVQTRQKNYRIFGNMGLNAAMRVLYYGALIYSAVQLMNGMITFGTLTAVTQLVNQVEGPLAGLSSVIHDYIAMMGSAERIMELEQIPGEEEKTPDGQAIYEKMDVFRAEHISFTYPDDEEKTIEDMSFIIEKGKFTVVSGQSGTGKSTLLKLLLGIYQLDSGAFYVEGKDGNVPITRGTRGLFSYVPQDNLLISGTLRDNLLLVKPDATEEEIQKALYVSALDDFVSELPKGLETELLESATGISGGQAQRLSIARAMLQDAPVLLLDEATSALDEGTELKVLSRIRELQDKTVIVVTHRPAAKEIADAEIKFNVTGG